MKEELKNQANCFSPETLYKKKVFTFPEIRHRNLIFSEKRLIKEKNGTFENEVDIKINDINKKDKKDKKDKKEDPQSILSIYKTQMIKPNLTCTNFNLTNLSNISNLSNMPNMQNIKNVQGNVSLLPNSEVSMKNSFLTLDANSTMKQKIEGLKHSNQKLLSLINGSRNSSVLICDDELSKINRKILHFNLKNLKQSKLYENTYNEVNLSADYPLSFSICSKGKNIPLHLKVRGISENPLSLNCFLSAFSRKPTDEDCIEKIKNMVNNKEYRIYAGERRKSKFSSENIFLTFSSKSDLNLRVYINFGLDCHNYKYKYKYKYIPLKNMNTKILKEERYPENKSITSIGSLKNFSYKSIEQQVQIYLNDQTEMKKLLKQNKQYLEKKKNKYKFGINSINMIKRNCDVKNSYNDYLFSRMKGRLEEEIRKRNSDFLRKSIQKDELIKKILNTNKWRLKTKEYSLAEKYILKINKLLILSRDFVVIIHFFIILSNIFNEITWQLKEHAKKLKKIVHVQYIVNHIKRKLFKINKHINERCLIKIKIAITLKYLILKEFVIKRNSSILIYLFNLRSEKLIMRQALISYLNKIMKIEKYWRRKKEIHKIYFNNLLNTLDVLVVNLIEKFKTDKLKKGKNLINTLLLLPKNEKIQICTNYLKERKENIKKRLKDWISKKHLNRRLKTSIFLNDSTQMILPTLSSSQTVLFPNKQQHVQMNKSSYAVVKKPFFRTLPNLDLLKKILLNSI